jgi:uncharacterized protein (DUF58 family)
LVTLVTLYIALIYASATIGLLAFTEAVLLVLAFLFLFYCKRRIRVDIAIPIPVVSAGVDVAMQMKVENRTHLSCRKVRYRVQDRRTFSRKKHRRWMNGDVLDPGASVQQHLFRPRYAGNYEYRLEKVRIYDPSGLFYLDKKVRRSANVQILPEITCVGVRISEQTRNFFGDADIYDDLRAGDDCSEIFDVREFREGDKIQSIHWKLTAKTDDLLVRSDSHPLACPVVFLLESPTTKNVQGYLSIVASVVFSLMDAGCPHFAAWYSERMKDVVRVRVDDEESYYLFLTAYLEDCGASAPMRLESMYREKYRFDQAIYTMILSAEGELRLNGYRLDTDLAELELLL